MAVKIYEPEKPLNKVLRSWIKETLAQLVTNTQVQKIFPVEVYPGYAKKNAAKPDNDPWKSTGRGVKSFRGKVISGDTDPFDVMLQFEHLSYLKYVDLGVGKGTHLSDVDSSKKGNYLNRYISLWDRRSGKSQRPAIMMEMRHLQHRMDNYFQDYYGYEIPFKILKETFPEGELEIELMKWSAGI